MALAPHHDYSKKRNNPFGFYVSWQKNNRACFHSFATLYAAKHYLDIIIDGDSITWDTFGPTPNTKDQPMIRTERGITIRGTGIEEAMEHEFTKEERDFVFPEPEHSTYHQFPHLEHQDLTQESRPEPQRDEEGNIVRPKREPKPTPAPRPSKEGLVTVQVIAEELGIDAKLARQALRTADVPKPDVGWAWPEAEVADIVAAIVANVKKGTPVTATTRWGNKPLKAKVSKPVVKAQAKAKKK